MISIYLTDDGKAARAGADRARRVGASVRAHRGKKWQPCAKLCVEPDLVRAALDEEERSRIDFEDGHMLVLVDTPTVEGQQGRGFVYSHAAVRHHPHRGEHHHRMPEGKRPGAGLQRKPGEEFFHQKKNRMTLQLLYRNATLFLFYLREVDKASSRVENELHLSMKNKELIQMLGLEKSRCALFHLPQGERDRAGKLLRMDFVKDYPDDTELLEDVIIENKQAIEMSNIYRDICPAPWTRSPPLSPTT